MTAPIKILSLANDLASHAYRRQGIIAANIANADTPGFRAKDLEQFSAHVGKPFAMRSSRPGHHSTSQTNAQSKSVLTDVLGAQSPNGNNVSIEDQMMRSADIKHQHELALGVYKKSMAILRASLGRR